MLPKTIQSFNGPKVNAKAKSNNSSQYGSDEWNRAHEDLAQATRTISRAIVSFRTNGASNPLVVNTIHRSVWGVGVTQKPVIIRIGVGIYVITYATSFSDGLGVVENVAFAFPPTVSAMTGDSSDNMVVNPVSFTANTITLAIQSPPGTLADAGNNSGNDFTITSAIV